MGRIIILILFMCSAQTTVKAQADELAQLSLNITKLKQFKKTLQNLYDGYRVVSEGYTKIKGVTEGTYSLHQVFLDGLMIVSPGVKNYVKVAEIIRLQKQMITGYKTVFNKMKASKAFGIDELSYMSSVYANLINKSLDHVEELALVISSSRLRMSDDERLTAIDRIYDSMKEKWTFLQAFNNSNSILGLQRQKQIQSNGTIGSLYGINH